MTAHNGFDPRRIQPRFWRMLVDAVNHRQREGATTVLGPFYVGEHKVMPHGTDVSANLPGERMFVQSRVTDLAGKPRFLFEGVACRMAERTLAIGHCVKSPRDSQRHI